MRIAVNTRFLLPRHLEGIGLYTQEVLRRLTVMRPQDEFIFFFDRPYQQRYIFSENVRPLVLQPPARHPLLWYLWFEWSVESALKKHRADVFFSPDGYLSLRSRTPTIMTLHDLAYLHYPQQIPRTALYYYRHFIPRYVQRAEQLLAVSEYTKQDILSNFHLPEGKVKVSCNGVREAFAKWKPEKREIEAHAMRQKFSEGKPFFLYVGALHPRKNIPGLLHAFELFKQRSGAPHLLLLSGRKAWMTAEIKHSLDQIKHRSDVRFTGYLNEEELPPLMRAAFALTYVSFFEGFGVPLLEAMHSETPIITAKVSSMPEVAGPAALYADPRSSKSIAEAMLQLYQNPQLGEQLIQAGRKQRQHFSWEKAARDVDELLSAQQILHGL